MIVGLCSTYLEGPLAREAVASLVEACDLVLVLEGPCAEPLTDPRIPPTEIGDHSRVLYREGRWRTDARKRTAMLEWAKAIWRMDEENAAEPLWGVVIDGDEVLCNGRFVRDWLRRLDWEEQLDPEVEYTAKPIRGVELDGSVYWSRCRLIRLDRIHRFVVGAHVFETRHGRYDQGGNLPDSFLDWEAPRREAIEKGMMLMMPPLPTEPYFLHRTMLRHPLRGSLGRNRLHHQEPGELARHGVGS